MRKRGAGGGGDEWSGSHFGRFAYEKSYLYLLGRVFEKGFLLLLGAELHSYNL